jgi:hypothetical protein
MAISEIGGTLPAVSRLLTPSPFESSGRIPTAGPRTIDIDLGGLRDVDALLLGYVYAGSYPDISVSYGGGNYSQAMLADIPAAHTDGAPYRHYFVQLSAPITARFLRFTLLLPVGATVGTVAVGRNFSPLWGHEYGSGRAIEDTGTATRLSGGGFGIDEGVAIGGYQFTFGDLQPDEVRRLYQIVKDRRTTRSLLIVEDPEQSDGLNERIHWGLLHSLEAYERIDPMNTKWSLKIRDWG